SVSLCLHTPLSSDLTVSLLAEMDAGTICPLSHSLPRLSWGRRVNSDRRWAFLNVSRNPDGTHGTSRRQVRPTNHLHRQLCHDARSEEHTSELRHVKI